MQRNKLNKIDKIVFNMSVKYCKSFMEMLQREEICGSKGIQH